MKLANRSCRRKAYPGAFNKSFIFALSVASLWAVLATHQVVYALGTGDASFRAIPTQFIAALGDPEASSGYGADSWGLWQRDPGPRGVWLKNYQQQLVDSGGIAPAKWDFDREDWWLDENGLIMEQPVFSVPPGKYIVTGDRDVIAVLTIHPMDDMGRHRWELGNGARLFDVTHLPCRSARYTPQSDKFTCTPANAQRDSFPVQPGGPMPVVSGCHKQDYAVLFIIAEEVVD